MEPAPAPLERSVARLVAVVAPVAACGLLASCLLSGYDKAESGAGGSGGSGGATTAVTTTTGGTGGAGGEGGTIDLPACDTTDVPAPPATDEPGGPFELVFALKAIRFGDPSNRPSVPGFDLDRADGCRSDCSGEEECRVPAYLPELTTDEEVQRCDFVNGIDNSGVHLFARLAEVTKDGAAALSDQASTGVWSLIVRVRGWNGLPEDPSVQLALFSTPGWTADGAGGGLPTAPAWNGADVWPIDRRSIASGSSDLESPAFVDLDAYVTGGVVVGALGATFHMGTDQLPVALEGGVLVAPIVDFGLATVRLENAVFAGRWSGERLIDALGPLDADGTALCNRGVIYQDVVEDVCKLLDVTADGGAGECDALSLAFAFDAFPIVAGSVVEPVVTPDDCLQTTTCADVFSGG